MIYPNGHIDYLMYENGGALIGVAKVTMPPFRNKHLEFPSVADAIVQLGTNEWHDVALYLADQYFDGVTRKEELEPIRFELSIRPTEINQGTIQTASAADASGT